MDKKRIRIELFEHLPFTAFGAGISIILFVAVHALFLKGGERDAESLEEFYHAFHALHILLSAFTSTALSFRMRRNWSAAWIGFITTVPFCVMSDTALPILGGFAIGVPMKAHICIVQEPLLVLPFLFFGIAAGMIAEQKLGKVSYLSHGAHVMVSSFASLFYLVSFGRADWMHHLGAMFLITFMAVIVPCCLSDIIFPASCTHAEHDHPHP